MISLRGTGGNYIFKERPPLLYGPLIMSFNVRLPHLRSCRAMYHERAQQENGLFWSKISRRSHRKPHQVLNPRPHCESYDQSRPYTTTEVWARSAAAVRWETLRHEGHRRLLQSRYFARKPFSRSYLGAVGGRGSRPRQFLRDSAEFVVHFTCEGRGKMSSTTRSTN